MLADRWVWIVAFAVIALLGVLLIWRGRAGEIGLGLKGLSIRIPRPAARDDLSVVREATIAGEVAGITGREIQGAHPLDHTPRSTDVARRIVVAPGAKVGMITGERISGAPGSGKPPTR